jgi:apolipoprotein D and lipocalin family protein
MGNSSSASVLPALQVAAHCDTARYMGTWFVIAVKPTMFEKTCSNAVENYSFIKDSKKNDIDIDFKYNSNEPITSPIKSMPQKGWVQGSDKTDSGEWKVSPLWPIKMAFLILEVDEEYSYTVIGVPSRDYCWIMSRKPIMPAETYDMLKKQLVDKHQYSLEGLREVPQVWTEEERTKRGYTKDEIPDSMLTSSDK